MGKRMRENNRKSRWTIRFKKFISNNGLVLLLLIKAIIALVALVVLFEIIKSNVYYPVYKLIGVLSIEILKMISAFVLLVVINYFTRIVIIYLSPVQIDRNKFINSTTIKLKDFICNKYPSNLRVIYFLAFGFLAFVLKTYPECRLTIIALVVCWFLLLVQIIWDVVRKYSEKKGGWDSIKTTIKKLNKYGPVCVEISGAYILGIVEIIVTYYLKCSPNKYSMVLKIFRTLLTMLVVAIYTVTFMQVLTNWLDGSARPARSAVKMNVSLVVYELAAVVLFATSIQLIATDIIGSKLNPYDAALYLFLTFIFNLVVWFAYFSYCGWILKENHLSLSYEFWTLLMKSTIQASIAYGAIESQIVGTVGLGKEITILLCALNCWATTFYPMIDMYKYVRKSLETRPIQYK